MELALVGDRRAEHPEDHRYRDRIGEVLHGVHPGAAAGLHLVEQFIGQVDHEPGHARDQVRGVWWAEVPHELSAHRVVFGRVCGQHAQVACLGGFGGVELRLLLTEQARRTQRDIGTDPRVMGERGDFRVAGDDVGLLGDLGNRGFA